METTSVLGFEDPVSSWLHLLGAVVFLVPAARLLHKGRGHKGRMFSLLVFVLSVELLLTMSGVYHLLPPGTARQVLRRLDHAAIFVLIAGTFTPGHTILFRGWMRWGVLGFVWVAAITSITVKTVFFKGFPEWLGLGMYLGLGWVGAISGVAAWRQYGFKLIAPMVWGALAYTFGAIFEFLRWPWIWPHVIGPHEMFHVAVLIALGYHWYFIYRFAHGAWDPHLPHSAEAKDDAAGA
jgi:channel protein (hemolysin III family)